LANIVGDPRDSRQPPARKDLKTGVFELTVVCIFFFIRGPPQVVWHLRWAPYHQFKRLHFECFFLVSAVEQSDSQLEYEVRRADVICCVYAVDDEDTLDSVTDHWLPFIRFTPIACFNVFKCCLVEPLSYSRVFWAMLLESWWLDVFLWKMEDDIKGVVFC
jgi:hypothetical protein